MPVEVVSENVISEILLRFNPATGGFVSCELSRVDVVQSSSGELVCVGSGVSEISEHDEILKLLGDKTDAVLLMISQSKQHSEECKSSAELRSQIAAMKDEHAGAIAKVTQRVENQIKGLEFDRDAAREMHDQVCLSNARLLQRLEQG